MFRVCIVGTGPAAFYTADKLLKNLATSVHFYEQLPVPFGLVRFGVAPDHPEVKLCINRFDEILQNDRVKFYGNVKVGKDLSVSELLNSYDTVVFAQGTESDRSLGIKGEHLAQVYSASSFVGWYNGHPDFADPNLINLSNNISTGTGVIIGQGNVALDVARILMTPVDVLSSTDITKASLEQLKKSHIHTVKIIGRRGPVQAAFTIKEFREMTKIQGCQVVFENQEEVLKLLEDGKEIWMKDRPKKRMMELVQQTVETSPSSISYDKRNIVLKFLRSPIEILSNNSTSISSIVLAKNQLDPITQKVTQTTDLEEEKCDFVVKSIGYKGTAIPGVPFDDNQGIIPNRQSRVYDPNNEDKIIPGLYAAGWIRRGPTGVIVSTMTDAQGTASVILKDLEVGNIQSNPQKLGDESILPLLKERKVKVVNYLDWKKIDQEEIKRGQSRNSPREKITSIQEMLQLI